MPCARSGLGVAGVEVRQQAREEVGALAVRAAPTSVSRRMRNRYGTKAPLVGARASAITIGIRTNPTEQPDQRYSQNGAQYALPDPESDDLGRRLPNRLADQLSRPLTDTPAHNAGDSPGGREGEDRSS